MAADAVPEIMGFINHQQVVIAPVQAIQIKPVRLSAAAGQVGMKKYVVVQAICRNRVVDIIILIGVPVLGKLFRAEHQHGLVAALIVLDHRKGCEGFSESHAISQDTAVVSLKLIDDRKHRVALKVIEQAPDFTLLKSGRLVRQHVLGNIVQKFMKHVVERHKIDELRRILLIDGADSLNDRLGHILHSAPIVPKRLKVPDNRLGDFGLLSHFLFDAKDILNKTVPALCSQIDGGKFLKRGINRCGKRGLYRHRAVKSSISCICFEFRLFPNPRRALSCNAALREFVPEFNLEFRPIETGLSRKLRNIKFLSLLLSVSQTFRAIFHKTRRGVEKAEFFDAFQFFLQGLIGIDGKAGSRNRNLASLAYGILQIIQKLFCRIIQNFYRRSHVSDSPLQHFL